MRSVKEYCYDLYLIVVSVCAPQSEVQGKECI